MQKTLLNIDINTRTPINVLGEYLTRTTYYPQVERGQWQIFCFQFYDRQEDENGIVTLTAYPLLSNTSFVLVGDNDFIDNNNNLMFKSLQSVVPFDESDTTSNMFNIAGDWIDGGTADYALGQLSVRINTDTVKFEEVMAAYTTGAMTYKSMYLNLKQYTLGISNPSTLAWVPFMACNTVRDWSSAQVVPPPGTQVIAYINTFFRNPLERIYAITSDGEFSTGKDSGDRWYKERISGIGADWSTAYELLFGTTFIPSVSSDSIISWTNSDGWPNPTPMSIKGDAATISVASSVTHSPTATPLVVNSGDVHDAVLHFTLKDGATYTPAVSSDGIISWTNDAGLANPSSANIIGPIGNTGTIFTPAVSSAGVISWTNDSGFPNPDPMSIKGPAGLDGMIVTLGSMLIPFTTVNSSGTVTASVGEVSSDNATILFSRTDLAGVVDNCEYDLIDSAGYNISADTRILLGWLDSAHYHVSYQSGVDVWPTAAWVLKPRGVTGRDGSVFDRVTVSSSYEVVKENVPQYYYWTAVSGATLAFDFSTVVNRDVTLMLKITMPSPVVSFTWPSITWIDEYGAETATAPDMSVAGVYWIAIHNDANGLYGHKAKGA